MKKIVSLFSAVLLGITLTACAEQPQTTKETEENVSQIENNEEVEVVEDELNINVVVPAGVPALSMVQMISENPEITENSNVNYEITTQTDVLTSKIINKEADIAVVPTNLAATLHSKDTGFKIAGSSVWGVMYVVSNEEIETLQDLKGKTIATIGQNLTPDAVTRYILEQNGLTPDEDVQFEYFSGASELASYYISGQSDLAIIPQPVLTNVLAKREDSKVVFDIQEEWLGVTQLEKYPQASLIVSEQLILDNPQFVDSFIEKYSESTTWINDNAKKAGEYYEQLQLGLPANIVEKAIPYSNIYFVNSEDAKNEIDKYLEILFDFNPKLIGGNPIDDEIYK